MVETLAPHKRLALYNLTEEEIEQIEVELVKQLPREQKKSNSLVQNLLNYFHIDYIDMFNPSQHIETLKLINSLYEISRLDPCNRHCKNVRQIKATNF